MPNFVARVRTSYRDVEGLVLSCARDDVLEDTSNPGYVREWINRAPGLPSTPAIRAPGDAITYAGGRYSNPKQTDTAKQPTLALTGSGQKRVQFDRARATELLCDALGAAFPSAASYMAIGYQFEPGADLSNDQTIAQLHDGSVLKLQSRDGTGDDSLEFGAAAALTAGAAHTAGTFLGYSRSAVSNGQWWRNGASHDTGAANQAAAPVASVLKLGSNGGGEYLDGTLDSMHVWAAELSTATREFIFKTLNEDGTDYGSASYGDMSLRLWTDLTADALLDEFDRLRVQTGRPFYYPLMSKPTGTRRSFQLSAAVDGIVLPDSGLGGDLFVWDVIEKPGNPPALPFLNQDVGWSAVADFDVDLPGHYTVVCSRPNGGSMILHVDVEDV